MLGLYEKLYPTICSDFSDAETWDEMKTKFDWRVVLQADSYNPHRLFKVKPSEVHAGYGDTKMPKGASVVSPEGGFIYSEAILPKGYPLNIAQGKERGQVCFDGAVAIPKVCARLRNGAFNANPWMSMTPMEIFTQRAGLRRAKGHTVIAGLGLGWLLQQVAHRKSVKKITLVEISHELIDWVLPRLDLNPNVELQIACGDARKLVPHMTADVALTDIDPSYGGNTFPKCPKIDYVWTWGSANRSVGTFT